LSAEGRGRDALITQSATLGIRRNDWKYIEPLPEGKTIPTFVEQNKNIESGFSRRPQLYDLSLDPGEQNNLVEQFPELAAELQDEIDRIRTAED
jgi:arylsulfatase A